MDKTDQHIEIPYKEVKIEIPQTTKNDDFDTLGKRDKICGSIILCYSMIAVVCSILTILVLLVLYAE